MPKKGSRTGKIIKCEYCGKEVYKTLSQLKKGVHHFCSNKCQKLQLHEDTYEFRHCIICGKIFSVPKISSQTLCSTNCQKEWQKTRIGKLNSRCTREELPCDNCGKMILVKHYKVVKKEKHFCSNKCRQIWYAKDYSQRQEWKEECRLRGARLIKDNVVTNTKPQIIINKILDELKIKFTNEKQFEYFSLDNYLDDFDLAIEVNGDFWHSNPNKYDNFNKLRDIQKKIVGKDKAKRTYFKKNYFEILNIWENDIYKNEQLCKELILLYIKNNGKLQNYNSFNYSLVNNQLTLNDNIIYPYFEKHIINA